MSGPSLITQLNRDATVGTIEALPGSSTTKPAADRIAGLYAVSCLLLGGIFTYAGLLKIISPIEFAKVIAAYRILPNDTIPSIALGLPLFEISCGILLLTGFARKTAAMGTMLMLIIFIAATLFARFTNGATECGCFGTVSILGTSLAMVILRDGALLIAAIFVYSSEVRIGPLWKVKWQSLMRHSKIG